MLFGNENTAFYEKNAMTGSLAHRWRVRGRIDDRRRQQHGFSPHGFSPCAMATFLVERSCLIGPKGRSS